MVKKKVLGFEESAKDMDEFGEIIIYQTDDGLSKIEVNLKNETVWLSIDQMAELFQRDRSVIGKHVRNIFKEGELVKDSVWAKFAYTAADGKVYDVDFYNLDVIISVGYRVKSIRGTQFRIWANSVLKEYIIKGFAMDDDRLKGNGGGNYWKELLDRIRDIRSSEKVLYRQVLDLYATSVDYNPKSEESIKFFKIVQNKLHYAAHGHTAAEVIYERADAEKPFMGLTSFSGELPALKDIGVAKNYLKEDELKILNNLVSGYFDLAEINAIEHKPMYMSDYVEQLDSVLSSGNRKLLVGAGSVSHDLALQKAKAEYRKYQEITLSPVEEEYLKSIRGVEKEVKKRSRTKK
ncbi:virulence RhuM family protein [Butyrivibrio sp. WCD2001]|uniref:virulence RhuM family protein n=1 Tax=Butyrivibrio sp. WCD2001 TaxID=1280681 RepID=UPI00041D0462|nr:virulence RhuM family protein [Butyrivibrio sp. WCD2001]